jgi:23S rRNA pseudouridine2605 synthase
MDFKDNKWQHPDKESGEGASRDGNANKSNRVRPRFTTSASGKNFSSSNVNKPRFNQERDNSQSQRPYSREDGNRNNTTQRNYNSNDNNNSSRSYKPAPSDGQRSYNREGTRDYTPHPYRGTNDASNSNRNYSSQDSNQRRFDSKNNSSFNRGNDSRDRRDSSSRPYSPNNSNRQYPPRQQQEYRPLPTPRSYAPLSNANEPLRLNKYLANAGICSRREADEYIKAGVVTVNGQVISELGTKILPTDKVVFHDQTVQSEKKVYILLNKPKDFVTTVDDPKERKTVLDLVRNACNERIYPVGRLDRSTTGVLLLTNDGDLASKLTHPKYNKKKIYHAYLDKALTKADMEQIVSGIELEDGEIHADEVHFVDEEDRKQVGIEIHSGRNRIVRRIFDHLGYRVKRLDRVFFAGLTKKGLPRGTWRYLTQQEVNMLKMGAFE